MAEPEQIAHASSTPEEQPDASLAFDPGDIAPAWASPYPEAELTPAAERTVIEMCRQIAMRDVAAQRWSVEGAWQERLFYRGFQYLFPRRGGGWVIPPFATSYQGAGGRTPARFYGNEVNIYATYCDIITAALCRDIPAVRFEPQNPESDADITAKDAATRYARLFRHQNDLLSLVTDIANYLCTDGLVLIITDHVLDAQRFGRKEPNDEPPVVPETEQGEQNAIIYVVRHGETELNQDGKMRGRSDVGLDEKGERQTDRMADYLKGKKATQIIASPVPRALETAQLLAEELKIPISADDRFASLDIGEMAGGSSQDAREDLDEAFSENPQEPIQGGESPDEFVGRVEDGMASLLAELSAAAMAGQNSGVQGTEGATSPVVLVTHDSVITALFKYFQGGEVIPTALTPEGGIAAVCQNADGTYDMMNVWPMMGPEPAISRKRGRPLGREVAKAYGKLETKVPVGVQTLDEMDWCRVS